MRVLIRRGFMGKLQRTGQWLKHQTKLLVAITLAEWLVA
jgi:hypothetical protein